MKSRIRYTVTPIDPKAHRFEVSCEVAEPSPAGERLSLPTWIPGSYLIREFARNVVAIRAEANGASVPLAKVDKHSWQTAPLPTGCRGPLVVTMTVHAWDLSVRGAHLDQTHGFFNGAQLFLRVEGRADHPCQVDIRPPEGADYRHWRLATSLPTAEATAGKARRHGFGVHSTSCYDDLIDHPVEMGGFELIQFTAAGVPHELALTGRVRCDTQRLEADLARLCAWHIHFFGEPAPFDRYLFLVTALGDNYGGLEHRASCALLAGPDDLPRAGLGEPDEGYARFLGLCSHEYFHAWNVKRIRPQALAAPDLGGEAYTRLLWAFEGFTSYYDELALVRCGLSKRQAYLDRIARTLSRVRSAPGRLNQSVADSSFDAWIKFYRPDENTPNSTVSYYAKGSLVALALDLKLRAESEGGRSLDDVMRLLWREHGLTGRGVPEEGVFEAVARIGGDRAARFLRDAVEGTQDLPLERLLKPFGVRLTWQGEKDTPALGVRLVGESGLAKLAHVLDGGAAQRAGLAAGDLLVAVDGLRVTHANFENRLARFAPGEQVEVLAFRQDLLMRFDISLEPPAKLSAKLASTAKPGSKAAALLTAWLDPRSAAD